jgi:hypothetical protein
MNSNKREEIDSRFNMVALFEQLRPGKIGPRRVGGVNPASRRGDRWGGFDIRSAAAVANVEIGSLGLVGRKLES